MGGRKVRGSEREGMGGGIAERGGGGGGGRVGGGAGGGGGVGGGAGGPNPQSSSLCSSVGYLFLPC